MKKDVEKINKKLADSLEMFPVEFWNEPKETNMLMREALARMYGDNHFRAFLENAVKYANRSLIASANMEQSIFYKARMETLVQLLNMGKQHFIHFEMHKAKREPLKAVEKVVAEVKL